MPGSESPDGSSDSDATTAKATTEDGKLDQVEPGSSRKSAKAAKRQRERRFTITIALISAASGIVGAMVGGFSSITAAVWQVQQQSDAQQFNMRKELFANFLTDETDLIRAQKDMCIAFSAFAKQKDAVALQAVVTRYNDANRRETHSSFIVSLVDSASTDRARGDLAQSTNESNKALSDLMNKINGDIPLSLQDIQDCPTRINNEESLFVRFTNGAQADMLPPRRTFWSSLF